MKLPDDCIKHEMWRCNLNCPVAYNSKYFAVWNSCDFFVALRRFPLVAGSVGPYGACQHDGSEYSGKYVNSMSLEVNLIH